MNKQNKTSFDAFERVSEARKESLSNPTVVYLRALEAQVADWLNNIRDIAAVVEAHTSSVSTTDDPSLN